MKIENDIKISRLMVLKTKCKILARANIILNEQLEMCGFVVVHNPLYPLPIVMTPSNKKGGKYFQIINFLDKELQDRINQAILKEYATRTARGDNSQ